LNPSAREAYVAAQVHTATPQKLQLMLIDGALRFAAVAKDSWGEDVARDEALTRCRKIMTELLASVRAGDSECSDKLADIYFFVYRTIVDAQVNVDQSKLSDAMKVLEVERETWRQVCEQFGSEQPAAGPAADASHGIPAPSILTHLGTSSTSVPAPDKGFSLEA